MYIGIDLGSTNIKAAIYNEKLELIDRQSKPVHYIHENGFVEFDVLEYCGVLVSLLKDMIKANNVKSVKQLAFTGQAESLVVVKKSGQPLMNAISWMDERSIEECDILAKQFSIEECEQVTGQQAILPTWPATKILWLKKHKPDVYNNAGYYLLLKDYVIYWLTGEINADMSIATFSFFFDIYNKCYWKRMLNEIGVLESQLPKLVEPCSVVGSFKPEVSDLLGLDGCTKVNVGTLDHFAGMIGTGNITYGGITLSTGTVMAMAVMAKEPVPKNSGIAMHYGFVPNTHVMLPVAESGGVSLEWFRRTCMPNTDFREIDLVLAERPRNSLLFLPYLVGTNAPEFDSNATGVFWGLRQEHDAFDMAYAIMEGVAFVLKKNCECITQKGTPLTAIVATGGGAKSDIWCQLQADITGLPILVPNEKEAACLGAAIIAVVADGKFASFADAVKYIKISKRFEPHPDQELSLKYCKFNVLYEASLSLLTK
jgi:xylulokinase